VNAIERKRLGRQDRIRGKEGLKKRAKREIRVVTHPLPDPIHLFEGDVFNRGSGKKLNEKKEHSRESQNKKERKKRNNREEAESISLPCSLRRLGEEKRN